MLVIISLAFTAVELKWSSKLEGGGQQRGDERSDRGNRSSS